MLIYHRSIPGTEIMMDLPIDVVPGTAPPRFRWKQIVRTPSGAQRVPHEGALPPHIEGAVAALVAEAKRLVDHNKSLVELHKFECEQVKKLQAFKDWVHSYLDARGVPAEFPDGEHTKRGCRIGDRMDHVFAELEALRKLSANVPEPPAQVAPSRRGRG